MNTCIICKCVAGPHSKKFCEKHYREDYRLRRIKSGAHQKWLDETRDKRTSCSFKRRHLLKPGTKTYGRGNKRYVDGKQSKIYRTWAFMIQRTENTNNPRYKNYGGRGIKVCDKWKNSFDSFYNDMYPEMVAHVNTYGSRNTSIDRIDNNKGYYKENCRWSTIKEQANNRNKKYGHYELNKTATNCCREFYK